MLQKLKDIAHKWPYSKVLYDQCGCGYKKPKIAVWASLAVLGVILYLL